MFTTVTAYTVEGVTAKRVPCDVEVQPGLPSFAIVGLSDAAVRESRERVRAALINSGFEFPQQRIVVNLSPAFLPRTVPALDLPIAVGLLAASGQLDFEALPPLAFVGELALDGATRAISGALPIAEAARADGTAVVAVPEANGPEAALVAGIDVLPIDNLRRLRALVAGNRKPRPAPLSLATFPSADAPDLADLRGRHRLRRVLEVAAAGGHSLLMIGPPGAGKSPAALRLPSILPPPATAEALETARIASACDRLGGGAAGRRPFRAPHHTIGPAGLLGGGSPLRPGEATLAHRGVLFLEDVGEFRRASLEALRPVLETGRESISGPAGRCNLPARFLFVAAANPCPCGRGDSDPGCVCSAAAVRRYRAFLTGGLADRIDLVVAVRRPSAFEISGPPGESSALVRERVIAARERQVLRLGSGRCNAEMTPAEAHVCGLGEEAASVLQRHLDRGRLGGPALVRAERVARTLADLDCAEQIEHHHIETALALTRRTTR